MYVSSGATKTTPQMGVFQRPAKRILAFTPAASRIWLWALLSALLTFLVYSPALKNGFVNWDDGAYVYSNPLITAFDLGFIKTVFTTPQVHNWHPLTMISFCLDFILWGPTPFGYHLVNNLFHGLNTLLVFLVSATLVDAAGTGREGRGPGVILISAVAALLFGLHPIHVESVAWVSERKDVLSMFFFLLSVVAYCRYGLGQRRGLYYSLTIIFFILSLMSKPMAITLPVVLLIIDFYPLRAFDARGIKQVLVEKTPLIAISGVSACLTLWAQKGALATGEAIPYIPRVLTSIKAYPFYIYKTLLPVNLAPYYPHTISPEIRLPEIASFLTLIGLSVFCVMALKRTRLFLTVWLYYLITLSPVIGIIQVGGQAAADRYMYLPSLGPFMLAGVGADALFNKFDRRLVLAVFTLIFAVFGVLTVRQIRVWRDPISLWTHEIETEGIILGYTNRATAYQKMGKYAEAIKDYTVIIESGNTDLTDVYLERGLSYQALGDFANAVKDYTGSLGLSPGNVKALNNRGNAYKKMGLYGPAIKDLEQAASLSRTNPAIYFNLGLVYLETKDDALALQNMKKAAELGLREAMDYLDSRNDRR